MKTIFCSELTSRNLVIFVVYISISLFVTETLWAANYRDPNSAQDFVGSSINSLVANWGEPDVQYTHVGRTTLVYRITTSQTYVDQRSPAIGVNMGAGNRPTIIVSGPPSQQQSNINLKLICTVQFEANRDAVIVNAHTQGNGC